MLLIINTRGNDKIKCHFKQLAAPFRIYPDIECIVKNVRSIDRGDNTSDTEKYQSLIPCSFSYELVCTHDKFSKSVVLYRRKNVV